MTKYDFGIRVAGYFRAENRMLTGAFPPPLGPPSLLRSRPVVPREIEPTMLDANLIGDGLRKGRFGAQWRVGPGCSKISLFV